MPDAPFHPNWTPKPIPTYWDDLLDGVATPADWAAKRPAMKRRFLDLLRDDEKPPVPRDLQIENEREWDGGGFTIRRITYNVEDGERATAYVGIPTDAAPAGGYPAVLCIQGTTNWGARQTLGLTRDPDEEPHGNDQIAGKDYARALVRAGFVTISPEHFNCSRRRPPKAERPFDTADFYKRHPRWTALGKSTFENRLALDVLETLSFVDRTKLGTTGFSLGGTNSMTITAYDERIRCAAPNGAAMTFNQWEDPLNWSRDHWYVYVPHIREALLRGERIPCDQHEWLALCALRPVMELFATNDTSVGAQTQRVHIHLKIAELYRLLGAEPSHAYLAFGDGHTIPMLSTAAIIAWMERWLKHGGDPIGSWNREPAKKPG
jgi:dienelactone hydrolase